MSRRRRPTETVLSSHAKPILIDISSDDESESLDNAPSTVDEQMLQQRGEDEDSDLFVSLVEELSESEQPKLLNGSDGKRVATLDRETRRAKDPANGNETHRKRKRAFPGGEATSDLRDAMADISNLSDEEPIVSNLHETESRLQKRPRNSTVELKLSAATEESPHNTSDIEKAARAQGKKLRRVEAESEDDSSTALDSSDDSEIEKESKSESQYNSELEDLQILEVKNLPDNQRFLRQGRKPRVSRYTALRNARNAKQKMLAQRTPRLAALRSNQLISKYALVDSDPDDDLSDSSRMSTDEPMSLFVS